MMKNILELGTSIVAVCHTVSENLLKMEKKGKYKSGNLNKQERNSNASSQLKQGRRHILLISDSKVSVSGRLRSQNQTRECCLKSTHGSNLR